ncbi:MAG: transcriptional regulator [Steroidobacteraceae bacterium]
MNFDSTGSSPVVLSIRPRYVDNILAGLKTVELRRRFPKSSKRSAVLFYSTAPIQAIVGHAVIEDVVQLSLRTLWRRFSKAATITRDDFDAYFKGVTRGCALHLSHIRALATPIHLAELTHKFEFYPPQSYCYWREPLTMLNTYGGVTSPT